jgi:hypothetical protein
MCQVVSGSQVVADEPDIAFNYIFQNELVFAYVKLDADVQFGRAAHRSPSAEPKEKPGDYSEQTFIVEGGPASLAIGRVLLHCRFQNEQVRNAVRVAVIAAKHLLELASFWLDLPRDFINGGSESGSRLASLVSTLSTWTLHCRAPFLRSGGIPQAQMGRTSENAP